MQSSIVVVVDVAAALAERTLEGNFHMVDNTRALGSIGEGRPDLVSAVVGVHRPDGTQATEAVLNWVSVGISALPPTLSRSYNLRTAHPGGDRLLIDKLADATDRETVARILEDNAAGNGAYGGVRADMPYLPVDPRNAAGLFVSPETIEYVDLINPTIVGVRGQAVDDQVIFPALYGSPDFYTEGWYWSASVDTSKTGTHAYILDLQLLRPIAEDGRLRWEPEVHSCAGRIQVSAALATNGFTGTVCAGVLPLVPISAASDGARDE